MEINLIAAVSIDGGIGVNGDIPWKDTVYGAADTAYFRKTTRGRTVIMGRRTYESIPEKFRPLPGRTNIVISTTYPDSVHGIVVARSFNDAIDWCIAHSVAQPFVIGGAAVYESALLHPKFKRAYITRVSYDGDTDTKFPLHLLPAAVESNVVADGNIYVVYTAA